MGRRLMTLQRQQLLHNQMVDLRARRVLHDEVLPDLQAALIELDATRDGSEAATLLSESHRRISDLLGEIPTVTADVARLGFVPLLRQVVDREFAGAFDEVNWQIEPLAAEQVNRLPAVTAETLFYAAREAIRNAARHGRDATAAEPYRLRVSLAAGEMGETLDVRVEDNGKGVGHPGGDTDHRGQGLALFGTMMAVVGGSLTVDSAPGRYTRVRLSLPQAADVAAPDAA
jgi:signal transduction histidine kinase